MATDREGTTISVGDVVFPAGKVTSIDGTTVVVKFKPGQIVAVDSECLVSANVSSGGGGGSGVTDGDKGDITVSSSGAAWTIDSDAVTYDKMQDTSSSDVLLGRETASGGTIEEIACTAAGRALLDDANAGAQRTTLGLGSAAVEDTSAFAAASHTHTLSDVTDSGALAALDTVDTSEIDNDAVTYAKIQNVSATDKLLGRSTAGAGVVEEIDCTSAGRALLDDANAGAQRTTLGLGSAAVEDTSAFAAASHNHDSDYLKLDSSNDPITGDLEVQADLDVTDGDLGVFHSVSGGEAVIDLKNDATTGASGSLFKIRTSGSSTGDAWFRFENASRYYTVGLDTSQDEFRIGTGGTLSSGNLLRMTSGGVLYLTNDLSIGSSASGAYSFIVNSGLSSQSDIELRQGGLTNLRLALLGAGGAALQVDGSGLGSPATIFSVTTGNLLDMESKRVTNAADPTSAQDLATKAYVDDLGDDAAAAWQIVWRDHFDHQETQRWDAVTGGSGQAFHQDASSASWLDGTQCWGVLRVSPGGGTASSDYASFNFNEIGQLGRVLDSTGEWRFRFRVATNNDGNLAMSFGLAAGDATSLSPTNSLTFECAVNSDTNIIAKTNDGSTPGSTDTGEAISSIDLGGSGAFRWFEIRSKSGQVQMLIDNSAVATFTTNLPTAANSYLTPFIYAEGDGATHRSGLIDYVDMAAPSDAMPTEGY